MTHVGFTTTPKKKHFFTLSDFAAEYEVGDVLSELLTLSCATLAIGMGMRVTQINVWERSPAGTQVKAALRFRFFNQSYTPPDPGDPFKGPSPSNRKTELGYIDIASADYEEIGDGETTDPDYANAHVPITSGKQFFTGDTYNTLWMLIEMREEKEFEEGAELQIEIQTEYI